MTRRCLVLGCGYLGLPVAARWRDAGHQVVAVTRSANRAAELQSQGLDTRVADVLQPASLTALPPADWILYAIGYDRGSQATRREIYVEGLRNVLAAIPTAPQKLVYVSSTGVYGQSAGEVVDESSLCAPTRESGQVCFEAERLLASHPLGGKSLVLRMAGLYGPGRMPRLEALRRGEPLPVDPDSYLNLVHVDDAVAAVCLAAERGAPPRTYCVSDGNATDRRAYYEFLAERIGAARPRFGSGDADRGSGEASKRVDSGRIRSELGWRPQYPSFREGLAAALASPGGAP